MRPRRILALMLILLLLPLFALAEGAAMTPPPPGEWLCPFLAHSWQQYLDWVHETPPHYPAEEYVTPGDEPILYLSQIGDVREEYLFGRLLTKDGNAEELWNQIIQECMLSFGSGTEAKTGYIIGEKAMVFPETNPVLQLDYMVGDEGVTWIEFYLTPWTPNPAQEYDLLPPGSATAETELSSALGFMDSQSFWNQPQSLLPPTKTLAPFLPYTWAEVAQNSSQLLEVIEETIYTPLCHSPIPFGIDLDYIWPNVVAGDIFPSWWQERPHWENPEEARRLWEQLKDEMNAFYGEEALTRPLFAPNENAADYYAFFRGNTYVMMTLYEYEDSSFIYFALMLIE